MRIYLLYILIAGLLVYAWRDWFVALCGLIVLSAIRHNEDFPSLIAGIPGLNPWNLLLVGILVPWALQRRQEGMRWDMPSSWNVVLALYIGVVVVSFVRAVDDLPSGYTFQKYLSEYGLEPLKYLIPGLLLYDGCRTRHRMRLALGAIVLFWFVLAVQTVRTVPMGALMDSSDLVRYRRYVFKRVGYTAVSVAVVQAGAAWAAVVLGGLFKRWHYRIAFFGIAAVCTLALALTGSRGGYVAFLGVGIVLGVVRWRRLLPIVLVGVLVVSLTLPGVVARVTTGFGEVDVSGQASIDQDAATAGRANIFWPLAVDRIAASPILGYGRLAFERTVSDADIATIDPTSRHPGHPHNMYLEMLLDGGLVGLLLVLPFYLGLVWIAIRLFRSSVDATASGIGGTALAAVCAALIAGMGAHTLYPREISVGMFALFGLCLRIWVLLRPIGYWPADRQLAARIAYPCAHRATRYG